MIIKFGPTIVGARGSLGGITFSANLAGAYAKMWARPPKTRTAAQATTGNTLGIAAQHWRTLSPANITAWNLWASTTAPARFNSLGIAITLSGFQWFVELSTKLLMNAATIIDTAPVLAEPAVATPILFNIRETGTGTTGITFTNDTFLVDFAVIRLAQGASVGQQSFARPNYYVFRRAPFSGASIEFSADVEGIWGLIQLERSWFAQLSRINPEGLEGPSGIIRSETI